MKEFIQQLVNDYNNNVVTWHDIQDIVEARIMQQDGQGMTTDRNIIADRFYKTGVILAQIEDQLKGGE
jgi:hypothetical protein